MFPNSNKTPKIKKEINKNKDKIQFSYLFIKVRLRGLILWNKKNRFKYSNFIPFFRYRSSKCLVHTHQKKV